jgi:anthranilate/para-aminobenzoate synthase component I
MIVDLMRNDLSRVAAEGSVVVEDLLVVESYANVHQLVSTVSAQLRPECNAADAVEACFPAGSMTGAPKISAMSILAGLEGEDRGLYSGAYGFFGDDGAAELAVVIRSLVIDPTGARIGSGGGITIDSDPAPELAEMHVDMLAEQICALMSEPMHGRLLEFGFTPARVSLADCEALMREERDRWRRVTQVAGVVPE